ncbi:MAG: protoglobin domain-containing protein [Methylovulum sp.]|nr:protoglobin domain-containing protein [Methylovulum sp.]
MNPLFKYAKTFSGLTPEREASLKEIAPEITPHLQTVTNSSYNNSGAIPSTARYLDGGVDKQKDTHLNGLIGLFTKTIDVEFAQCM